MSAMNFYEHAVAVYLANIERVFAVPQVKIGFLPDGARWEALPDFVALDFRNRRLQVIEVTKAAASAVGDKLLDRHRKPFELAFRHDVLARELPDWPIVWRFFVRESVGDELVKHPGYGEYANAIGEPPGIVTLESVFAAIGASMP